MSELAVKLKLPLAFKEYLLLMGRNINWYEYWDEHGTNDIVMLRDWISEWIKKYREERIPLIERKEILPFLISRHFFNIPIEVGVENPPVYAFDINDTPEIRKLFDKFTDFVKWKYNECLLKMK